MARTKQNTEPACEWRQDDFGNWDTACNEMFVIIDGTPKENNMRFCCYCGKRLVQKPEAQP